MYVKHAATSSIIIDTLWFDHVYEVHPECVAGLSLERVISSLREADVDTIFLVANLGLSKLGICSGA